MNNFWNVHQTNFKVTTFVPSSLEVSKLISQKKLKHKQRFIISIHETRTQRTLELKGTLEHSNKLHYIKNKEAETQEVMN